MCERRDAWVTSRTSMPVHQHAALEGVVEARDEVDEAGLAGAAAADEGDGLARLGVDDDVLEHDVAGLVAEGDMLQVHAALDLVRVRWHPACPRPPAPRPVIWKMRAREARARL